MVAPSKQLPAAEPIAVTVLSGFLGSGKTTLLNYLLHHNHGQKLAVIVNEFGSVGIDGALVSGGERFVELDNGCLCCALNDDLRATLVAIVERVQAGEQIDRIVIESTGLADPLPVAWAATRPEVSRALRVDAIVTVVDAANIARALAESREAALQVERADLVVLNKRDLVDDDGAAAAAAVREINALAPHFVARDGEVPWSFVMAAGADVPATAEASKYVRGKTRFGGASDATAAQARGKKHEHEHGHEDGHEHEHAQPHGFQSYTFCRPASFVFDEARCETMAFAVPADVIRFKALLRVDDVEGPWLLVHGVGGRIDLRFLHPPRPPAQSAWVFFGRALDVPALQQLCATHLVGKE